MLQRTDIYRRWSQYFAERCKNRNHRRPTVCRKGHRGEVVNKIIRPHRTYRIDAAYCYGRGTFCGLRVSVTPVSSAKRLNRSGCRSVGERGFGRRVRGGRFRCVQETIIRWRCTLAPPGEYDPLAGYDAALCQITMSTCRAAVV